MRSGMNLYLVGTVLWTASVVVLVVGVVERVKR